MSRGRKTRGAAATQRVSKGAAGNRPPLREAPVAPPGERVFVLDVPFELRAVAQLHGAKWHDGPKAHLFVGRTLPEGLAPFRSRPFSWERWIEDDVNGERDLSDLSDPGGVVYEPRPHQEEAIEATRAAMDAGRAGFLLADEVGVGKAQPLDALVLTAVGFKRMGDIAVGERLVAPKGGHCKVVGVFPQGVRDIYRVTFSDGATVECDADHLWAVNTTVRRDRGNPELVLPLRDIMARPKNKNGSRRHFVPMTEPVELEVGGRRPLDSYLLGVLLGDGSFKFEAVGFSTADKEIVAAVEALLPSGVEVKPRISDRHCDWRILRVAHFGPNPVTVALRSLGLMGRGAGNKFVPEAYKIAPSLVRLAVLQGLLDTDGSISATGGHAVEFSTTSERLASDVVWLVRSLGGRARAVRRRTSYTYNGEKRIGKPSVRVRLSLPADVVPFRLSRKAKLYPDRRKYPPARAVDAVEYVGRKQARCIAVDAADQLYVTDDFVVTHNTISALGPGSDDPRVGKLLVVCTKSAIAHWRQTLQRLPAFAEGARVVVVNYDRLKKLLKPPESASRAKRQRTKNRRTAEKGTPLERFDYVVADEAHHLGNKDSQRSRAFRTLAAEAFVVWTSATAGRHPLKLSYLAPLLAQLTPSGDADLLADFEAWCARQGIKVKRGAYGRWEWERNDEDLKKMHGILFGGPLPGGIRRLPTDVDDWPEVQRILWPLALNPDQRRLYEEAWAAFRAEMGLLGGSRGVDARTGHGSTSPLVAQLRFRQKASLLRVPGTADLALDMLENGYQVFVSVEFHDTLEALREILEESGVPPAVLHGRMTGPDRESERLAFQRGHRKLILSTITQSISLHEGEERGGEAPRVTLAADPRWSPIDAAQVEGRAHRNGKEANVYYLYGEDTVEERVVRVVVEGMKDMKAMHGDDVTTLQAIERELLSGGG